MQKTRCKPGRIIIIIVVLLLSYHENRRRDLEIWYITSITSAEDQEQKKSKSWSCRFCRREKKTEKLFSLTITYFFTTHNIQNMAIIIELNWFPSEWKVVLLTIWLWTAGIQQWTVAMVMVHCCEICNVKYYTYHYQYRYFIYLFHININ